MSTIGEQIAAISPDALEWLNEQLGEFMQPSASYFDAKEWQDTIDADRYDPDSAGWYSRLSAPGYLDCTEWQGPYESEAHALVALYETYGE